MLFTDQLKYAKNLTENETRISDYIQSNLTLVSEMPIQKLAAATYTSHSAIVRFAKKLDYDGYKSMRHAITTAAQQQKTQLNDVDANFPFKPTDSAMDIAKNMSDLTINAVKRTLLQLDEQALSTAATQIIKAKRLFLFAIGDSQIRARSLQSKLIKINKFAVIADEYSDESWTAANLTEDDLAIFISYTGDGIQRLKIIEFLGEHNVPTLLFTGNPESKLITYATQTILTTQDELNVMKVSTFASQIAFEYLLNTLFAIVYSRSYQQNLLTLKDNYKQMTEGDILDKAHRQK